MYGHLCHVGDLRLCACVRVSSACTVTLAAYVFVVMNAHLFIIHRPVCVCV